MTSIHESDQAHQVETEASTMTDQNEVVIVGAGPVGLWTAIQLKLRRPDWAVVLYERQETYVRSHVLRLDHWSLLLYGRHKRGAHDDVRRRLYDDICGKQLSKVAMQPAKSLFIRTNDLEQVLRTTALAMGAELRHARIESPAHAQALHPACQRFIAADGARSAMRSALLGDDSIVDVPLRRVVELKYETQGSGQRLSTFGGQLKANRKLSNMAFEYVGRPKDGRTPVTLRFFVDDKAYEDIGESSFKAPLALESERVPSALRADILDYMQFRAEQTGEQVCMHSARLTKLTLSMYHAKDFVATTEGGTWFLTGDAAMGVPYFRALNSGLILSSRLAQLLCAKTWPVAGPLRRQERFYRFHQAAHVQTEFAIARGKDALLTGYDWARQLAFGGVVSAGERNEEAELVREHLLGIDCMNT